MGKWMLRTVIAAALCLAVGCAKKATTEDNAPLLKIGGKTYSRADFNDFTSMVRFFPLKNPQVFPGLRKSVTTFLETELLYSKVPGTFRSSVGRTSADWKWREKYYTAQLYIVNVLVRNLSIEDTEIEAYYNSVKEDSFKTVVKVPLNPPKADSTGAIAAVDSTAPMKDSVYYKPLAEVREKIVRTMFLDRFPPDTGYVKRYFGDSVADSSVLRDQWYQYISRYVRTRDQDFFLKRFFPQAVGGEMPDSIPYWFGKGKAVEPRDVDLITTWLPAQERERFEGERGRNELARWVLRWHVYAKMAEKSGYARSNEVRSNLAWAWKFHVVNEYLERQMLPRLRKGVSVDTALCMFSLWDDRSQLSIPPDSAGLANDINVKLNRRVAIRLDSLIYGMRLRKNVTFLQSDYKDDKVESPVVIRARADSARDSGATTTAEQEYRKLVNDYPFAAQSHDAYTELAKLLTERQSYKDAIRNYRLQLFHTSDSAKMCNTYFMLAFIYDEYLNMPDLAEVNYKWVLKNTPTCELCDDAEFMMLHLDEPMIRIEDLRAEALRQGRKIDYSAEDTAAIAMDSAAAN